MSVYLPAKFQVSSIILTNFRQGGGAEGGGGGSAPLAPPTESASGFTLILIKHCNGQTSTDLLLFLTLGVKCQKESFSTFYHCFPN